MTSCGYPKIPASYGSGGKGARMQKAGTCAKNVTVHGSADSVPFDSRKMGIPKTP